MIIVIITSIRTVTEHSVDVIVCLNKYLIIYCESRRTSSLIIDNNICIPVQSSECNPRVFSYISVCLLPDISFSVSTEANISLSSSAKQASPDLYLPTAVSRSLSTSAGPSLSAGRLSKRPANGSADLRWRDVGCRLARPVPSRSVPFPPDSARPGPARLGSAQLSSAAPVSCFSAARGLLTTVTEPARGPVAAPAAARAMWRNLVLCLLLLALGESTNKQTQWDRQTVTCDCVWGCGCLLVVSGERHVLLASRGK